MPATINCPVCHRSAPVTTGLVAHHKTGERPCAGIGLPARQGLRVLASDLADRTALLTDLHRGKLGLSWQPFMLAFYSADPAQVRQALEAILPLGRGDGPHFYERDRAARYALRLGASHPALLVDLLEACADASDCPGQVCDLLINLPRP